MGAHITVACGKGALTEKLWNALVKKSMIINIPKKVFFAPSRNCFGTQLMLKGVGTKKIFLAKCPDKNEHVLALSKSEVLRQLELLIISKHI